MSHYLRIFLVFLAVGLTGCNTPGGSQVAIQTAQLTAILTQADTLQYSVVSQLRTELDALQLTPEEMATVGRARRHWDNFYTWLSGFTSTDKLEVLLNVVDICTHRSRLEPVTGAYFDVMMARESELTPVGAHILHEGFTLWENGSAAAKQICTAESNLGVSTQEVLSVLSIGVTIGGLVL